MMISNRRIRSWCCDGRRRPPHIPADVLWKILSHLSINDLYRAKSISREWNSIITNHKFIETHTNQNQTPACLGLLISTANSDAREFQFYYARLHRRNINGNFFCRLSVPYSDYQGFTQVVHGVVCFYSADRVSILNVCTRETQDLPQPPIYRNVYTTRCHLGFDKSSKAYKLLRLTKVIIRSTEFFDETLTVIEILTLTTPISSCRWRRLPANYDANMIKTPSFCVNGNLYWMHAYTNYNSDHGFAVVFNLELETFYADFVQPSDPSTIARRLGIFSGAKVLGSITSSIDAGGGGVALSLYSWLGFERDGEPAAMKFPVVFPDEVRRGCRYALTVNLPTGETSEGNDDRVDNERFVVGKFPGFVASMPKIEKASHIVCLEEKLTPLHLLLRAD